MKIIPETLQKFQALFILSQPFWSNAQLRNAFQ